MCPNAQIKDGMLRGAEEACWAHNPKVLGSKPSGARYIYTGMSFVHLQLITHAPIDILNEEEVYLVRIL